MKTRAGKGAKGAGRSLNPEGPGDQPRAMIGSARRGRPSSYDPLAFDKFLRALVAGNSRPTAARYAGIAPATMYRWLDGSRPQYSALLARVEQAEATARVVVVSNLAALSRRSSRAAAVWLRAHGGPEWRGRCSSCGAIQGLHEGGGPTPPAEDDSPQFDPVGNAASTASGPGNVPTMTAENLKNRILVTAIDPTFVPNYSELSKHWRWPIDKMLVAAAMGMTPAQFFKRMKGLAGLREDAEPPREWWVFPYGEDVDPETPPGNT